ncbi:hypothetical protein EVAR_92397_1 [Eumeta japonica]|uniref:Uncharacterized protein n=1 Tax=Eumeta variegata TaxID=151549 RepID=A0A4C1TM65_EUMVA|nr:hypothetical protein EVAR_92397_1 [Eumeta japonica]
MQLIHAGGCAIYKLQRNWCIRCSRTPAATCEARAAINKSEHRNAVLHFARTPQESVLRGDCEGYLKCGLTRCPLTAWSRAPPAATRAPVTRAAVIGNRMGYICFGGGRGDNVSEFYYLRGRRRLRR